MANGCCYDCEHHGNGHCTAAEEVLLFELGFLAMNATLPEISSGTCSYFTPTKYAQERKREVKTYEKEKRKFKNISYHWP